MMWNLGQWIELQKQGYFKNHPVYAKGFVFDDRSVIESFVKLDSNMNAVVIGCGEGREINAIAPLVKHVWGIDVTVEVLMCSFLHENFTPVLAQEFEHSLPASVDFVYSVAVMQHLPTNWVVRYLIAMQKRLTRQGSMVMQFMERSDAIEPNGHEPSFSRGVPYIKEMFRLSGFDVRSIRTVPMKEKVAWHWVHGVKA